MALFDRQVSILVGKRKSESALNVELLRVQFEVVKTAKKETNSAKVSIWNLSPDQRSTLTTIDKDGFIIIKAGYREEKGLEVLYVGDISFVEHKTEKPDIVTVIESNDGQTLFSTSRVSLSYNEGASAKQILNDILKAIPMAKRTAVVDAAISRAIDRQYANGFSFAGQVTDVLTKITEHLSLEWSVQDQEMKVVQGGKTDGSTAVVISPTTGMIGSPERRRVKKAEGKNTKEVSEGWMVRSLLQPQLEPAGPVTIESADIKSGSLFKVLTVRHTGDTHSQPFETEIEVSDAR